MKKKISIVLCAVMLVSAVMLSVSAASIDIAKGAELDGDAYLMKGDDGHPTTATIASPVFFKRLNSYGTDADTIILTCDAEISKVGELKSGEDFSDWKAIVAEYVTNDSAADKNYRYQVKQKIDAGTAKTDLAIPADGFIALIAPSDAKSAASFTAYNVGDKVAVQGVPTLSINWEIYKVKTAPTLDGKINLGEYGDAIEIINDKNAKFDYRHFVADDRYATGKFYACYDDEYFYFAVEIDSEEHNCNSTDATAADMWSQDCIQINFSSLSPLDKRNLDAALNWGSADNTTAQSKWVNQVGIGVNNDGDTVLCKTWMGTPNTIDFDGAGSRDDAAGKTIYEGKVKLTTIGGASATAEDKISEVKTGLQFGFSFSINTNDGTSRVLRLRDGGGIYGSNDFSKHPVVTLMGEKTVTPPDDSSDTSSKPDVDTSDMAWAVAVFAVVSLFGAALIIKKRA